ncbi:MAG: hypothetical protein RPU73_01950 [Candidatus Sedimenticola sp. (ex Thyasira tokunagai)]
MPFLIVTGDGKNLPVTLKKNGATFTIDPAAVVKAAVVSTDHSAALSSTVTCDNAASGADWANSLVVVPLSAEVTGAITIIGDVLLEIQVTPPGGDPETWFVTGEIVQGHVS